jgi:hypothetical protein
MTNPNMTNQNRMTTAGTTTASGYTERGGTLTSDVRTANRGRTHQEWRETKPSFMTTEFWAMLAGIVVLIVLYNTADNPDLTLWRTCLLCTVIASAYIVSRGWAKSGSHDDHVERDTTRY